MLTVGGDVSSFVPPFICIDLNRLKVASCFAAIKCDEMIKGTLATIFGSSGSTPNFLSVLSVITVVGESFALRSDFLQETVSCETVANIAMP